MYSIYYYIGWVFVDKYKIRNVIEEDFIKIAKIAKNCSPMTTERNAIYHLFTKFFKNTSLVVENTGNGNICAFLLGLVSQTNPQNAYIHLLCVDTKFRGKKLAPNLINKFIYIVSKLGSTNISLLSKPSNIKAIKFYNKQGFLSKKTNETLEEDGINIFKDYDGPNEDKIIFYKYI